jgi:multiple sugar transport system substrate-binding protein
MYSHKRAFAVLFAVALTATACSGTTADPNRDDVAGYDPAAKVTISWWTGQTADAEALAEDLAKEYMAEHPNVTIDVSSGAATTDELLAKLSAGFVSGT